LLVLLLGATACQQGPRHFANENDRLREKNEKLADEVRRLERTLEAKNARIQRLEEARAESLAPWLAPARVPTARTLRLGGFTGVARLGKGEGRDPVLRVYLRTLDQRDRFLPVGGRLTLRLVRIPAEGEAETLVTRRYGPEGLDDAYRSNLTGTHYSFDLPVPEASPKEATLKAIFVSGETGRELTAERPVRLRPASSR
jgi:hypothetical protein